jgi:iron(III) transport system substrate-binding protein
MLRNNHLTTLLLSIVVMALVFVDGCDSSKQLIVYTSVDQPFAEPVLAYYEKLTGVKILAVYDTEAAKTVGLVNRLRAEANSPKADVFWSSEFAHTIRLAREGIFSPYAPASATDIPAQFKDPQNLWTGACLRARVFIVNDKLASESLPSSVEDLLKPDWQEGQATIAFPMFGTTNTHAAALLAMHGKDAMLDFFKTLKAQKAFIADSNGKVRDRVVNGQSLIGLTDTDDAMVAIKRGNPVKMIFPDQRDDQPGTLVIPNTAAMIKNCPNPENAAAFLDFITSELGEKALIKNSEGFFSIRAGRESQPDWIPDSGIKALALTPDQIADGIASASLALKEVF